MPRIARAVAVDYPHHITQRGNYHQAVFESDEDYIRYLEWLNLYSKKYSLKIWAYCLMGNHVVTDQSLLRPTELIIGRGDPNKAMTRLGWKAKIKMHDVVRMMVEDELESMKTGKREP